MPPDTEEQTTLRASIRRFLDARGPEEQVRADMDTTRGFDPETWREVNRSLGLAAIAIPDRYGGWGGAATDVAVVFEECGRALFTGPLFSTVGLGVTILLQADDDAVNQRLLPQVAAGELTLAVAGIGADAPLSPVDEGRLAQPGLPVATSSGDGWVLNGWSRFVVDGAAADVVLLVASTPVGPSLVAVERTGSSPSAHALPPLDQTRRLADLTFVDSPAVLVGTPGAGQAMQSATLDRAVTWLAAEQVGGASKLLDMTVTYAGHRTQFGRPIGSFQAVQHLCADMLIALDEARIAAHHASATADDDPDSLPEASAIAKIRCSEAYFDIARTAIQVHGGIGFTWEHPAHLYYRRAKSDQMLLGSPSAFRERLAGLVLG